VPLPTAAAHIQFMKGAGSGQRGLDKRQRPAQTDNYQSQQPRDPERMFRRCQVKKESKKKNNPQD